MSEQQIADAPGSIPAPAFSENIDSGKIASPSIAPLVGEPISRDISAERKWDFGKWAPRLPAMPSIPAVSSEMKKRALIAATVVLAAGIGAATGAITVKNFDSQLPVVAAKPDAAAIAERQALQKSVARLNAEIATLKGNIEAASKQTTTQMAKITDRFERVERAERAASATPVPLPAPAPETTASIAPRAATPPKPPIVEGWFVREGRNGVVLVENRGELFEVVVGAPLPGLGRIESIKREDGRWVVKTPKGLITSLRMPPKS